MPSYGRKADRPEFIANSPRFPDHRQKLSAPQEWQPGNTLDQKKVGACIGFSGTQDINCTPYPHAFDDSYALQLYWWIKEFVDKEPNQDTGSTHESLVVALRQRGFLGTYSITSNASIAQAYVDNVSPVILGTIFYNSMENPDKNGIVAVDPSSGIAGGHSYAWIANVTVNGVLYAVCQNSWGLKWGIPFRGIAGGFFLVPMTGIYHLLGLKGADAGDVLAFTELGTIPAPPVNDKPGCLSLSKAMLGVQSALTPDEKRMKRAIQKLLDDLNKPK